MGRQVFLLGFCLLLLGCNSNQKKTVEKEQIKYDYLFEEYFNDYLTFNPNSATYLGLDGYNDKWANNLDENYLFKKKAFFEKWRDTLQIVSLENISDKNQNEIEILNYLIEDNIAGLELGIQPGTMS